MKTVYQLSSREGSEIPLFYDVLIRLSRMCTEIICAENMEDVKKIVAEHEEMLDKAIDVANYFTTESSDESELTESLEEYKLEVDYD